MTQLASWLDEAGLKPRLASPAACAAWSTTRARAALWINGRTATVSQLRELGEHLVDIHGQHAWQKPDPCRRHPGTGRRASRRSNCIHASGLDRTPPGSSKLDDARTARPIWTANANACSGKLPNSTNSPPGRRVGRVECRTPAAQPRPSHSGCHPAGAGANSEADDSAESLTSRAIDALDDVARYAPDLANALDVLRSAQAQLQDAAHSLSATLRHTDLDPDRLAEIDGRMSLWMSLSRRYRRTPAELPELLQSWKTELAEVDAAADLAALEQHAQAAHQAWQASAKIASQQRAAIAPVLSHAVTEAMRSGHGGRTILEVALVKQDEPQAFGLESVEFLVAGHAGSTPRPWAKWRRVASRLAWPWPLP